MPEISQEYLSSLPRIYKDVLAAFPEFDPMRQAHEGLAFQSLYSVLSDKYTLGEIRAACEALMRGGALEIKERIFAHPTDLGEDLIEAVTGRAPTVLPPFSPPPGY